MQPSLPNGPRWNLIWTSYGVLTILTVLMIASKA